MGCPAAGSVSTQGGGVLPDDQRGELPVNLLGRSESDHAFELWRFAQIIREGDTEYCQFEWQIESHNEDELRREELEDEAARAR